MEGRSCIGPRSCDILVGPGFIDHINCTGVLVEGVEDALGIGGVEEAPYGILPPSERAAIDFNGSIPPRNCACARAICFPCIAQCVVMPILCFRKRHRRTRHKGWNTRFEAAIMELQAVTNNIGRSLPFIRCLTDPPIGSIPLCLPTLPSAIGVVDNTIAPHGGEWFYPSTGRLQERNRFSGEAFESKDFCCTFPTAKNSSSNGKFYPGSPEDPEAPSLKRVILYFHGGAFCLCSSRTHRGLLMRIAGYSDAVVLCINYGRPPECPWPIPIDHCLEAYEWMLGRCPASQIIFAGDSAGGGLVVAVMAAARAKGLPMPAGGVMWSPWLDLTDCVSGSWTENQRYDYLPQDWALLFAKAYAGENTLEKVSPGHVSLRGLPPLLIEVGDCECLHDQVVAFAARAKKEGVDVSLHVAPAMVHVFPLFYAMSHDGSAPEQAFIRLSEFVDTLLGQKSEKALVEFDEDVVGAEFLNAPCEVCEKIMCPHKRRKIADAKMSRCKACMREGMRQLELVNGHSMVGLTLLCCCLILITVATGVTLGVYYGS